MKEQELDAIVISDAVNRRYLTQFTGSAGTLIIGRDKALFATDSRYYEQVGQQAPDYQLEKVSYDLVGNLARMLQEVGAGRVGFEAKTVTVADYEEWQAKAPDVAWVATSGLVEDLRAIKDADELATMREAVRLTDEALTFVMDLIRPGMTEAQVGWALEKFYRERGAQNWSAGPIVASGPNSALPHARPTSRVIGVGEPIIVDMGCVLDGYFSDLTRTFVLSHADSRFEEIYSLVLKAHQTAEDGASAGLQGKEVDALGREVIEAAGYGENFGHGLGHGVGLAIHELPRAGKQHEARLVAGMTLTIEPGVYIPGWGGVRVEDMVVIQNGRPEVLTRSPKQLSDMVIAV